MNDEHPLRGLIGRVLAACVADTSTPKGHIEAEHRARLYRQRAGRELADLADARYVPVDATIRTPALDPQLSWPGVTALRSVLAERQERATRHRGRVPALAVLGGPRGAGKTTALAWAVIHSWRPALYVTPDEIVNTKRWGEGLPLWQKWERVDLLAIDECGEEEDSGLISKLLLHRWDRAGGFTIIAGNLSCADASARYLENAIGDRLEDRLACQREQWFHDVTGPSRAERIAQGDR